MVAGSEEAEKQAGKYFAMALRTWCLPFNRACRATMTSCWVGQTATQ